MTTPKLLGYLNFSRALENLNSPKSYSGKIINAHTVITDALKTKTLLGLLHRRVCYALTQGCQFRFEQ